jgi:hypothetical protein
MIYAMRMDSIESWFTTLGRSTFSECELKTNAWRLRAED